MLTRLTVRHHIFQVLCVLSGIWFVQIFATVRSQQLVEQESAVPISGTLCADMKLHHVLGAKSPVDCERLKLVTFSYLGFDEKLHYDGKLVVMDAVAPHVATIFRELRAKNFPIAKAKLMNAYDGNDNTSMADNNTSAFNDRNIEDGQVISLHAYGLAIDVNPIENPYLSATNGIVKILPRAGTRYVNRLQERPAKGARPGMAEPIVDVFADNGFLIWGGYWDNPIDYQHFQVGRQMAKNLAAAAPEKATSIFNELVERYRKCFEDSSGDTASRRVRCVTVTDPNAGP